jgi:hypothetical protein
MKISKIKFYDGAKEKVCRLGLSHLFLELQEILLDTAIRLLPVKEANGAAYIRERLDERFLSAGDWEKTTSGGVDWIKRIRYNQTVLARMGVEIQVSARSDLLIRDIVHLRNSLQEGVIDIGVIVLPDDEMQIFLTDRTPSYRDAVRYIEKEFKEATTFPIVIMAIEHDGISDTPLPKKKTNLSEAVSEIKPVRRTRRRT